MSSNSLQIVHEGWLTKSPPSKPILRARWRRRWFVLRHSGELPEQYVLEYYTDKDCRKLKGKIDLDQCEQVDAGLQFENRKQKYQHMFDVKTPKRTYFLAAESEEEMNKWVECVCHVCRLISYKEEEDVEYGTEEEVGTAADALTLPNRVDTIIEETESPPVSPSSTISGPYIPISECISGKPISSPNGLEHLNSLLRQGGYSKLTAAVQYASVEYAAVQYASANTSNWHNKTSETETPRPIQNRVPSIESTSISLQRTPLLPTKVPVVRTGEELRSDEFYDSPRQLGVHPPNVEHENGTPPMSPTTDGESVFTDDEWNTPVLPVPSVNWETFPNTESDHVRRASADNMDRDIGSWSVVRKFGRLTVVDSKSFVPANIIGRRNQTLPHKQAPPRPPKPFHLLLDAPSHNYLNLENVAARPLKSKQPVKEISATETIPPSPKDSVTSKLSTDSPPASPPNADIVTGVVTDETYDFPRSHQQPNTEKEACSKKNNKHCYTNAAPTQINGDVFRYDFHDDEVPIARDDLMTDATEEPTSPRSEGSSSLASSTTAAIYSNLPSPQMLGEGGSGGVSTPPTVDRGLKPGRKLSDSASAVSGSELSPGPITPGHVPPNVDRKLKPHRKYLDTQSEPGCPLQLAPPPDGTRSLRRNRAAPSPTPPASNHASLRNGQRNSSSDDDRRNSPVDEEIYFYQDNLNRYMPAPQTKRFLEIQYLDLDSDALGSTSSAIAPIPKSPEKSAPTTTVYKTVDFLKTQAFNMTRQKVEEERKQCPAS